MGKVNLNEIVNELEKHANRLFRMVFDNYITISKEEN